MISRPQPLQKLTIDRPGHAKQAEEEEIIIDVADYQISPFVSCFSDIPLGKFTIFDLTGHQLTNFKGIGRFLSLEKLIVNNTLISNFQNAVDLPNLVEIEFKQTPLSKLFYVREMTMFAFGFSIKKINGVPVSQQEMNLSQLPAKFGIENAIRRGDVFYSYPNFEPPNNYITSNYGFLSQKSSMELSNVFSKFDEMYASDYKYINNLERNKTIPCDHLVSNLLKNISILQKSRNELSFPSKWFNLQQWRSSSQSEQVEHLRFQLYGLKPSPKYNNSIENYKLQKQITEKKIPLLKHQIHEKQKAFSQVQVSLRHATELSFDLQMKLKDANVGNLTIYSNDIKKNKNELSFCSQKKKEYEALLSKLKEEFEQLKSLVENTDGLKENDSKENKSSDESNDIDIQKLLSLESQQDNEIELLKKNKSVIEAENAKLIKELEDLEKEIKDINIQKEEAMAEIRQKKEEFSDQVKQLSNL